MLITLFTNYYNSYYLQYKQEKSQQQSLIKVFTYPIGVRTKASFCSITHFKISRIKNRKQKLRTFRQIYLFPVIVDLKLLFSNFRREKLLSASQLVIGRIQTTCKIFTMFGTRRVLAIWSVLDALSVIVFPSVSSVCLKHCILCTCPRGG